MSCSVEPLEGATSSPTQGRWRKSSIEKGERKKKSTPARRQSCLVVVPLAELHEGDVQMLVEEL